MLSKKIDKYTFIMALDLIIGIYLYNSFESVRKIIFFIALMILIYSLIKISTVTIELRDMEKKFNDMQNFINNMTNNNIYNSPNNINPTHNNDNPITY